jgi:hypothetical protein
MMTMLKRFDLTWAMKRTYHEDGAYVDAFEAADTLHTTNYALTRVREELASVKQRNATLQMTLDETTRDTWSAYSEVSRLNNHRTIAVGLAVSGWVTLALVIASLGH